MKHRIERHTEHANGYQNIVEQNKQDMICSARIRVATARRNHSIPGQKRATPDPERISLSEAARLCGVSHHSIERLVETGLLKHEQAAPRAPWAIHRADLDKEPVRSIIERLLRTGKLIFQGDCAGGQSTLFNENEGDDNARHHE